jgi:hypothetical protein
MSVSAAEIQQKLLAATEGKKKGSANDQIMKAHESSN